MTSGLIQLVTHGIEDLTLTGNPQITFFKTIYRRYTNFAIESIKQTIDGDVNFGNDFNCLIKKTGDLINSIILEITLPNIVLEKPLQEYILNMETVQKNYDTINRIYKSLNNFLNVNQKYANDILNKININGGLINDIEILINNKEYTFEHNQAFSSLNNIIKEENYNFDNVNYYLIVSNVLKMIPCILKKSTEFTMEGLEELYKKQGLINFINIELQNNIKKLYNIIFKDYVEKENILSLFNLNKYKEYYKFKWIEEIGHFIIDNVEILIGGQIIDSHTGQFMSLFNQLNQNIFHKKNYDIMIGNIKELTTYDDKPKKSITLKVPLKFWFCRNKGVSIPLVALRYNDIHINFKLKNLKDCCIVESQNVFDNFNINILNLSLYVDYVFLDEIERKLFATSIHEYLIDTIQHYNIDNITSLSHTEKVNLNHPTKELIWVTQPNNMKNNNTINDLIYNPSNYNIINDSDLFKNVLNYNYLKIKNKNIIYPDDLYTLEKTTIELNTLNLTPITVDAKYYNYLQPLKKHSNTPKKGINVYSFSLHPEEYQPSGAFNFSRISSINFNFNFNQKYIDFINEYKTHIEIDIYGISYNVLRFAGGFGALTFSI